MASITLQGPTSGYPLVATPSPKGMLQQGNINLSNRPVVHNPDNTISTVDSMSIGTDKGETLIPKVVGNAVVSNEQAIQHYQQTGENLGTFDTPANADVYAQNLHEQQAATYQQPPSDSVAPALSQTLTDKASSDNAKKIQQWQKELTAKKSNPTPDPVDPLGIDWLHRGINFFKDVNAVQDDIIQGFSNIGPAILGGTVDFVKNAASHLDRLSQWISNDYNTRAAAKDGVDPKKYLTGLSKQENPAGLPSTTSEVTNKIPNVGPPTSTTEGLIRGTTSFLLSFVPLFRALKVETTGLAAGKVMNSVAGMFAAGTSAAVSSNPQEANLANLVQAHPSLANPVTQAMATNPASPAWENDLKNFMVGAGLTAIAEPFVYALGALKNLRQAKGVTAGIPDLKVKPEDFTPAVKTTETKIPEGVQPNSKEFWQAEADKNVQKLNDLKTERDTIFNQIAPERAPTITLQNGDHYSGLKNDHHTDIVSEYGLNDKSLEGATFGEHYPKAPKDLVDKYISLNAEIKNAEDFQQGYADKIAKAKTSEALANAKATTQENIYAGTQGQTHEDIKSTLPVDQQTAAEHGYVDKNGKFHTHEEMTKAIDQAKADQLAEINKASAIKFSAKPGQGSVDEAAYQDYLNGKGSLAKVMNTFSNTNMTSGNNIRQVVQRIANMTFDKTAKVEPVGKADLSRLANRLGITPYELSRNLPDIVANNHLFESLNTMLNASQNSISRLATELLNPKTINATGEIPLYNFLRAINAHRAILSYLRSGSADAATEIFGKMPPVKGSLAEQVNQAAKFLSDSGGATKVRTLAKLAIKDDQSFEQALRFSAKSSLSDIAMKYWYFNLLSNPLTQIRNIYGNSFHLLWQIPARNFAGEINAAKRLFGLGGPNGVAVNEGNALAYGMSKSFGEAWRLANKSWKTGLPSDEISKLDSHLVGPLTAADRGWSGLPAKIIDGLSWIGSLPGKSLLSADEFTKAVAKIGELHALAYREGLAKGLDGADLEAFIKNGVANPSEGAMAEAFDFSHEIAFTKDLGQMGQRIMSLVNTPVMNFPVLKMVVPFIRTNVNMFKTNVANSPYAVLSKQFYTDVAAGGARSDMALSKFALGSSAAYLVVQNVLEDRITGYGPVDPGLRATWMLTHKPNSFKVDGYPNKLLEMIPGVETAPDGSRWLNYGVLAHLSTMIGVTASLAESMGPMHPDDYHKAFHQISMSLTQSVLSQSWGRSFSGFMDFLQGDMAGMQWLQNEVASMAVPAVVTSVAHMSDPVWRETNGFIDTIKARIPGWLPGNIGSTSLNARHNIAGQPIYSQSIGPDIISPMYQFLPDNKPFFKWAWANQVPLQMPSKIQLGVDMKDDPANHEKFIMLAGNLAKINGKGWYDRMNDIIDGKDQYSGEWARGTDGPNGTRALMVGKLISAYRRAAEAEMLKDPVFKHKVEQVAQQKRYNLLTGPGDMPQ